VELEVPRQPLFPLFESSLLISYLIWVRGISRRQADRPIREDGKGGGERISMPGCSYLNNTE
jgi:hypothetical protein